MKAILVIDIPKNCKDCALNYDNQNCLGIEVFTKVSIEDDRPSWCPLKPMPNEACEMLVKGLDAMEKMKAVEVKVVRRTE